MNASGAIWWPTLQTMQMAPPNGLFFATNASGVIWWPNLLLMKVAQSGGQIFNLSMWCHVVAKFSPSHRVNFWVRCASGNVSLFLPKNVQIFRRTNRISGKESSY